MKTSFLLYSYFVLLFVLALVALFIYGVLFIKLPIYMYFVNAVSLYGWGILIYAVIENINIDYYNKE